MHEPVGLYSIKNGIRHGSVDDVSQVSFGSSRGFEDLIVRCMVQAETVINARLSVNVRQDGDFKCAAILDANKTKVFDFSCHFE